MISAFSFNVMVVLELFLEPVDWERLNIPDYPKIIRNPMDLGTVRKKICENEYTSHTSCIEDVRLIWRNCMAYNSVNL